MTERLRFSIGNARNFRDSGQFTLALGHYVAVLGSISPERRSTYESEFVECIENAAATSETEHIKVLSRLAQSASSIFPHNVNVLMALNSTLYHNGYLPEAKQLVLAVSKGNPFSEICSGYARIALANISSAMFHSWHIRMINDLNRNSLYEKAIASKVCKSDFVLEVGSGTGLLSVFASRMTSIVVGVEESKTLFDISKKVLAVNHSNAEIINCHSTECKDILPVNSGGDSSTFNVIISEIMDCCGFGEGVLSTMLDIHQRLASPGASFIPSELSVFATIVSSQSIFNLHRCKNVLSEYHSGTSKEHPYWCADLSEFPDVEPLSEPVQLIYVDLSKLDDILEERNSLSIPVKVCKSGTAHCIVVHFRAVLADGVILDSNIPGSSWDHGIFPFPEELIVFEGRTITADYSLIDSKLNIACREADELHHLRIGNQPVFIRNMDAVAVQRHWIDRTSVDWRPWRPRCVYKMHYIPIDSEIFSKNSDDRERFSREFNVTNEWDYFVTSNCSSRVDGCDAIIWDPINADGSLNDSVINDVLSIMAARWKSEIFRPVNFLPDGFVCRGMLVQSPKLARLSRPDPDAHCGVDLAGSLEDCHLFEYREINLESFPLESFSEDFNVIDVDISSIVDISPDTPVVFATNVIEVPVTRTGIIDGMVYWWESTVFSNKRMLVAAFIFKKQITVRQKDMVKIRVDYCNHSLLASLVDD